MPEMRIQSLAEDEAIEQIVETVQQAEVGEAPFALVLGSGFSQGLVPTARELVTESLPFWMKSLREGQPFDFRREVPDDERGNIARAFWATFASRNEKRGLKLPLDEKTGLPTNYADAYRAAFTPAYFGAVGAPAEARRFQRALMRLDRPRLNAAHFLLASLIGVQPGKSRRSDLFNSSSAFSRLILTTNFDPFLQTALQAVNRLYFMSDTPELGVGDEIFDDQTDAIHLVYLHGSIHRRSQAATEDDIKALKEKNGRTLAPVLKRHGVIVLGYSGWDDAIVEALAACDRFDHRLYWCGREADPLTKDAFGPRVANILRKPSALYVQTAGAGSFMAQLVGKLVRGLPRLLDNPIGQLREMLETIDLSELKNLRTPKESASNSVPFIEAASNAEAFVQAQEFAVQRLFEAEQFFRTEPSAPTKDVAKSSSRAKRSQAAVQQLETKKQVQQLLASARVASALGNHDETLKLCNRALALTPLEPDDLADLWLLQGWTYDSLGDKDDAISDYSRVIELPGAPVTHVAVALRNRGLTWAGKRDTAKALADYSRVIELPGAPITQVAAALVNRGFALDNMGEAEKALPDYTRVIEQLPGAPADQVARALRNRSIILGRKGNIEEALTDSSHVIDHLPGAPAEQLAGALLQRGFLFWKKGETDKALADYNRLIDEIRTAPTREVALALRNRGIIFRDQGKIDQALSDFSRLIQLPDAPTEDVGFALKFRGIIFYKNGDIDKASADYSRLIAEFPLARPEDIAGALGNRGWIKYLRKDFAGFLIDTELALNTFPSLAFAAFNRGLALLANGRDADAIKAYKHAVNTFPESIDSYGLTDLEEAKKTWLTDDRAKPVIEIFRLAKK